MVKKEVCTELLEHMGRLLGSSGRDESGAQKGAVEGMSLVLRRETLLLIKP